MTEKIVGVIGGSGLYEMEGIEEIQTVSLKHPFRRPFGFIQGRPPGRGKGRFPAPAWKGTPHLSPLLSTSGQISMG